MGRYVYHQTGGGTKAIPARRVREYGTEFPWVRRKTNIRFLVLFLLTQTVTIPPPILGCPLRVGQYEVAGEPNLP